MRDNNYESDFFAWSNEQAALLRSGQFASADIEHIALEIESMGRTEKRQLVSRLRVLIPHLLKWRFQPERRRASWRASIRVQRLDIAVHLNDNPSLEGLLPEAISAAYEGAMIEAVAETQLPEATFPGACPWTYEEMMSGDFWPD